MLNIYLETDLLGIERATKIRLGITSKVTTVPIEKQSPTGKNVTQGTRANSKTDLPEEGSVAPKGVMGIKRMIPLKRPIHQLPEVTSRKFYISNHHSVHFVCRGSDGFFWSCLALSQKTRAPPQVKAREIVLGDLLDEAVEVVPQTRTLRTSKRLAGPKGGIEEKAKGPLRSINKELQISSEATKDTNEKVHFNFRRLSGDARMDSTSAPGKNVNPSTFGKSDQIVYGLRLIIY